MQKTLCLMVMACSMLAFAADNTKKPQTTNTANQPQKVQNQPVLAPQAKNNLPAVQEQHKVVVRRVFDELFSQGRYESINEIYSPNCIVHNNNQTHRLEEAVAEGKGWRVAAPDLLMTANNMIVNGDFVTVDWTAQGTNSGRGNGMPASGKHIMVRGKSRFHLVNGKIAEVWNQYDRDELFRQAGVPKKVGHLLNMTQDYLWALNSMLPDKDLVAVSVESTISSIF
jgi:steroid delta-isomerase-like uncharacterized protein